MGKRVYNFYPGPAAMPFEVMKKVQEEFLDFAGTGMSVCEISHRSKEYDAVHMGALNLVREVYKVPSNYKIIFVGGGATLQFAAVPMNLASKEQVVEYVDTGEWSNKAIKEAKSLGYNVKVVASSEKEKYNHIPKDIKVSPDAAYFYICSNNTIEGTEWHTFPDTGKVPLVVDMSSDFGARVLDFSKFGVVYAGAQKNLAPAGVTVVIVREDLLARCPANIPVYMKWKTHAEKDSLYNTPPVLCIYVMKLVLEWIKSIGGLEEVERRNRLKAKLIYDVIDKYPDFYRPLVPNKEDRSLMNITFRLPTEELDDKLVKEAKANDIVGIKGYRTMGGIRVSTYNYVPIEGCEKLAKLMEEFAQKNKH